MIVSLFSRSRYSRSFAKRSGRLFGAAEWSASFGNLQILAALAAAPGFVRHPTYRQPQPMPTEDIVIFVLGCIGIAIFGVIIMVVWSRTGGRR